MKIRLGQLDLARGLAHRESPRQFSLATQRETQVAGGLRASEANVYDRGNARTLVKFAVARRHESIERALRFAATLPLALAGACGGLTFVIEDTASESELFLPNAALRAVRCVPAGLIVEVEYEFIGGEITRQPPRG